ncbi:MAG: RNA polymerase sigma factor SigZ [Lentisphaerae bacterium]|nr:RNA polymerase sigma factor SigZ [Lentisphaerota bacterium]
MNITVEQLWQDNNAKLRGFIQSRVGDKHTAEDILQDVFIRVNNRLDSVKEPGKVQGWIYRIARNAIIDHYRSRKITTQLPATLTAPEPDRGDQVRQEMQQWLAPMIHALPGPYRDTLVLADLQRVPQKEVAVLQGLSVPGAKARIKRGRRMLKESLHACCQFEQDHNGTVIGYESRGKNTCGQC